MIEEEESRFLLQEEKAQDSRPSNSAGMLFAKKNLFWIQIFA